MLRHVFFKYTDDTSACRQTQFFLDTRMTHLPAGRQGLDGSARIFYAVVDVRSSVTGGLAEPTPTTCLPDALYDLTLSHTIVGEVRLRRKSLLQKHQQWRNTFTGRFI